MINAQEVLLLRKYEKRYGGTFVVIGSNEIKTAQLTSPAQTRRISASSSINRVKIASFAESQTGRSSGLLFIRPANTSRQDHARRSP
jgi:hypothetical protein